MTTTRRRRCHTCGQYLIGDKCPTNCQNEQEAPMPTTPMDETPGPHVVCTTCHEIAYCPIHAAAPALVALARMVIEAGQWGNRAPALTAARALLATLDQTGA